VIDWYGGTLVSRLNDKETGSIIGYLAEFDFRYSNRSALGIEDEERAALALKGIEGKRLTYNHRAPNSS
jgi:hypothetical protein